LKFLLERFLAVDILRKIGSIPELVRGTLERRQAAMPTGAAEVWPWITGPLADSTCNGFMRRIDLHKPHRDLCLFVVVPDVVADARRTLEVFEHWAPKLHGLAASVGVSGRPRELADSVAGRCRPVVYWAGKHRFRDSRRRRVQSFGPAKGSWGKTWPTSGRVTPFGDSVLSRRLVPTTCDGQPASVRFDWMLEKIHPQRKRRIAGACLTAGGNMKCQ